MANFNIDYLVVAGGGGGSNELGGGGGAGGYLTNIGGTAQSLQGTITYTVVVGDGGRGGVIGATRDSENTRGGDGDNSSLSGSNITTITSTGGGGGGAYGPNVIYGRNGGSGGGAAALNAGGVGTTVGLGNTPSTTPSQGNNGGNSYKANGVYPGGGGGGAGAVGGNYSGSTGGAGGDGLPNTITGASPTPYYAGGGGGNGYGSSCGVGVAGVGGSGGGGNSGIGRDCATANGSNGTNGLGGGGGAATYAPATQSGGSGGSGVVILRYTTADVTSYAATGTAPTEDTTTVAGQTILSFTTVGTGSITFTTPALPFGGTKVTTPVTGFESPVDIGLKIPVGTNSNLPTGAEGMIRNDTDEDSGGTDSTTAITFYNGTDWKYFTSAVSQDSPPIENFNTVLYTGDGSASGQPITSVGFQPDLVWIKTINQATKHLLTDSVRGVNSQIFSNSISSEQDYDEFDSFDSTGFTVSRNTGADYFNQSTIKYVAWCFKAGGAAVANTNGSINSQVSVNDTLGFSIAKYTGNTTSGATVGHGLSSTPELILFKTLESGPGYAGWAVQVASLGGDKYLILNESQQAYSGTGYFNDTLADSDVITLGSFDVTNDGTDIIAYSFASKPGFSKVGTYTGNGGNNPVDVGFEPAFVMIKNTTSSASWAMFDNKRTTANPSTSALYANEAIIEEDLQLYFEFTSTGFKNLQSSNTLNTSSSIYIYLAFAK
jgi:hypothetical protein